MQEKIIEVKDIHLQTISQKNKNIPLKQCKQYHSKLASIYPLFSFIFNSEQFETVSPGKR